MDGAAITKCPGQDNRVWTDRDIYDVPCPQCSTQVEFWKDDQSHKCPKCGANIPNPRFASEAQ